MEGNEEFPMNCNMALGQLKEDPERIRALANYIESRR
jgi:hypothetical protein